MVTKLQTGFDERRLHTLFLDKEIRGISAIQTISRVNRSTKYKNDCKIIDFSYENVNVQNIKDAFEHFSDVVVSDFDPFSDKRVLDILYIELKKSEVYQKFFDVFMRFTRMPTSGMIQKIIWTWKTASRSSSKKNQLDVKKPVRAEPSRSMSGFLHTHLLGEPHKSRSTLRQAQANGIYGSTAFFRFIDTNPKRTADTKAITAQYFTILNRIEYVIELELKFSIPSFLHFWRKFNTLHNLMHRSDDVKDPIEVYFDNQIGIIEVEAQKTEAKRWPRKQKSPHGAG